MEASMFKKCLSGIIIVVMVICAFPLSSLAVERYEVLQIGDEDEWVRELQEKLYDLEYLKVSPTGYFGNNTQEAVLQYQNDNGLASDGKAGPNTRQSLLGDSYQNIDDSRVVSASSTTDTTSSGTQAEATQPDTTAVDNASSGSLGLNPGDKGEDISALQAKLKELEYYNYGSITGYYGPVTKASVEKFQRTHGLSVSGAMDSKSLELLYSGSARYYTMYQGDSSDDIRNMQDRLRELGYFNTNSTGYYGPITLNAVKMFQEANGLAVDGKAGKNTRAALYSDTAVSGSGTPPVQQSTETPVATTEETPVEQQPEQQQPPVEEAPVVQEQPATETTEQQPPAEQQPTPEPTPEPVATAPSGSIERLIEVANSQIGKGYSYGSNGPSTFDCSGFVYYSLINSGFAASRLSSAGYASVGSWASVPDMNSLTVGDLVFFKSDKSSVISHVGIYLGGGSIIHAAPSSGGVAISTMSSGYYNRNYVSAKRIV